MTLLTLFHQGTAVVIPPPTAGVGTTLVTLRELRGAALDLEELRAAHLELAPLREARLQIIRRED